MLCLAKIPKEIAREITVSLVAENPAGVSACSQSELNVPGVDSSDSPE
jgi:hypothetical protein